MSDRAWLKVEEVADLLRFHPESVQRWLRVEKLNDHLISRRGGWSARASEVGRFLSAREPEERRGA